MGTVPGKRDSPLFDLVVLITGAGGIIAQVILLRELLVGFYGNELTIGVILANWVIAEAMGVSIGGWLVEKTKNKFSLFTIFTVSFTIALPVAIYLARVFKPLLGIPFGQGVGLPIMFLVSFCVLLPAAFCHGALFNCGAKILSSLGRMYAWETLGTIAGGIVITYLFLPYLDSFSSVFIIGLISLGSCFLLWKQLNNILKSALFLLCGFTLIAYLTGGVGFLQRDSIARQWQKERVINYRNSLYGNIVLTRQHGQSTFFYNGQPVIVTPHPDIAFVEEFGNLPLLFHGYPKNALVIGAGAGGLINEILKHPVLRVDYTELDPGIIKTVKEFPDELTFKELNDPRVKILPVDGRFFLRNTQSQYDVILIGISRISDLTENRFFTQEFFALAGKRLRPQGILALWLPGSLTYLSQDLKDINAAILNSLTLAFAYVRIIPGDFNMFFASNDKDLLKVTPSVIASRITSRNIFTNLLNPAYLVYRLDPSRVIWFNKSLVHASLKLNHDLRPYAVFKALALWNKQFSQRMAYFLDSLERISIVSITAFIIVFTLILAIFIRFVKKPVKTAISFSIFTTGFFGMLVNLMLIFSFQVFTGYLFFKIGLLMSIFMAGSALGSILVTNRLSRIKDAKILFAGFELLIAGFIIICAMVIYALAQNLAFSFVIFSGLFFASGLFLGLEFPLAGKIYLGEKAKLGEGCAVLYAADLLGGWLAGIAGGVFFLPILGVFNTCMVILFLKLSSILILAGAVIGRKSEFNPLRKIPGLLDRG